MRRGAESLEVCKYSSCNLIKERNEENCQWEECLLYCRWNFSTSRWRLRRRANVSSISEIAKLKNPNEKWSRSRRICERRGHGIDNFSFSPARSIYDFGQSSSHAEQFNLIKIISLFSTNMHVNKRGKQAREIRDSRKKESNRKKFILIFEIHGGRGRAKPKRSKNH